MKTLLLFMVIAPVILFGDDRIKENETGLAGVSKNETISRSDAEKILGQAVRLTEEKTESKNGVIRNSITYTGLDADPVSSRAVNLYYIHEIYADPASAKSAYINILKSNNNMPGQSLLKGIGDAAWYHSDGENFSLILVLKNERFLRIKVSKLTEKFSKKDLQAIAGRIMG